MAEAWFDPHRIDKTADTNAKAAETQRQKPMECDDDSDGMSLTEAIQNYLEQTT